jgi:hypothetical protein
MQNKEIIYQMISGYFLDKSVNKAFVFGSFVRFFIRSLPCLISLYIDKVTLVKIVKAAAKEHISISKWVGKNIKVESIFIMIVSQMNFFS